MGLMPPARGGPVCLPDPEEARALNRLHDRRNRLVVPSPREKRLERIASWAGWLGGALALATTVGRLAFRGPLWGLIGLVVFPAVAIGRWVIRRRLRG